MVVEDDIDVRELICFAGGKRGYSMVQAHNGREAQDLILNNVTPDVIILDINMPKMDGLSLCRWLKDRAPLIPVIFLSAREDEYDKIIALEIGGDDYLTKPFSVKELFTRVAVCLRRKELYSQTSTPSFTAHKKVRINSESWQCFYDSQELPLTVTEFRILHKLISSPGTVFTRDQLAQTAFPEDMGCEGRSIDIHIARLRKKCKKIDPDFDMIETVFQVGYKCRQ